MNTQPPLAPAERAVRMIQEIMGGTRESAEQAFMLIEASLEAGVWHCWPDAYVASE